MKNTLTTRSVFVLLLALSLTISISAAQNTTALPSPPEQITLTFELQDLPGRNSVSSFWEVSYQWRIADKQDFDRWSCNGGDSKRPDSFGLLLSKESFTRHNLSASESRRFSTSVPVSGELLERLRNATQRPQIVWLDATVRIHDSTLGADVIKKVNPVWGPYFYREGVASLRLELTREGNIRWYTGNTPPWGPGKEYGLSSTRIPIP